MSKMLKGIKDDGPRVRVILVEEFLEAWSYRVSHLRLAERRLEVPAWLSIVITVDWTALGVVRLHGDDREL